MASKIIRHNNKPYAVFPVKYGEYKLPVLINAEDFKTISRLGKRWRCNKIGVYCIHTHNGISKEVYLHEIIMRLKQEDNGHKILTCPIIHINRMGLDNRRDNLIYDTQDKTICKNQKKKKRTLELPESSGINPDDIPTYVWYMKANGSHGDRFMVAIGDISWKTTSSKHMSTKYKLEEAKLFLRNLKEERPDLFEDYSMNGDFTKEGKELLESYYDMVHKGGYVHVKKYIPGNKTNEFIKANSKNVLDHIYMSDGTDSSESSDY